MKLAKILVLEGIDGSGKSTQIELIKKYFNEKNIKNEHIHFPIYNDNEASNIIAQYLRGELGDLKTVNPFFVANIFAMDRFLYLPKLYKKLLTNDIIILDRYVFSSMAYQGAKFDDNKLSSTIKKWIYDFEFNFLKLPYPDLTIFFDVPIEEISKRLSENRNTTNREYLNGKDDIHEKDIEYQKCVRENYLSITSKNYNIIKTGNSNPEEIFNKYKDIIDNILK